MLHKTKEGLSLCWPGISTKILPQYYEEEQIVESGQQYDFSVSPGPFCNVESHEILAMMLTKLSETAITI